MKHIIVLADGFADEPIKEFGGKTPMQAAETPYIDALCKKSRTGLLHTVPDSLHPGSEVANMAVLGYDVEAVFEGRGVLEAAAMGIEFGKDDLVFRCNLISLKDEKILNHSAGHITTPEAHEIIATLNKELGTDIITFYPGVSYRHVLIVKNGNKLLECVPPHDVPGSDYKAMLPKSLAPESESTKNILIELMERSRAILEKHPVNIKREQAGKPKADIIWPWSPGLKPKMPTLKELYGINSGGVISAVDLIHGIGKLAGLDAVFVEGVTGLYDTNYEGKVEAAVEALKTKDFVFLHIEASDEAGHEGDFELKKKTLEYLDKRVMKYLVAETAKFTEPVSIAILPDHPTPCYKKTHTRAAVPFMIYNPLLEGDSVQEYNEYSVEKGYYGVLKGAEFMKVFLQK